MPPGGTPNSNTSWLLSRVAISPAAPVAVEPGVPPSSTTASVPSPLAPGEGPVMSTGDTVTVTGLTGVTVGPVAPPPPPGRAAGPGRPFG